MRKGKLIVIEGSGDGIGKSTQVRLLTERYASAGVTVHHHHFPSYNTVQGAPVSEYLRGEYGAPETLSPYFINNLYALDRAICWHKDLKGRIGSGQTLILDRYVTSSMIYQSALMDGEREKREFVNFIADYEYEKLGIGKPDAVIFLHVPPEVSVTLRKERGGEGVLKGDIHESDGSFLRKVYENSLFLCDLFGWTRIECAKDGVMRPREEIGEEVFAACEGGSRR